MGGRFDEGTENKIFWLYTTLREAILPIDYYNQVIEPDVLSKTFNRIFEQIDPEMHEILGNIPSLVFIRHFINLFTEFVNKDISLAIFDLLFAFGSGSSTSTATDPETLISDEIVLCRTSQLLICIALAMTRQVLYDFNLKKQIPVQMAMNQFEDLLEKCVVNPNRLVNEVLQLENYIFRNARVEDPKNNRLIDLDQPINDLQEILMWKPNSSDEYASLEPFRSQIYAFVIQTRRESYERACNFHQNLIKKKKGVSEINITNFLRRFAGFDSLLKFDENKDLCLEAEIEMPQVCEATPGEEEFSDYKLEHAVV